MVTFDDEDDADLSDDPEAPDAHDVNHRDPEEELDGVVLVPCPYCHKAVYEEAEFCPNCGKYISREDSTIGKPMWFVIAAVACLVIVVLFWVL